MMKVIKQFKKKKTQTWVSSFIKDKKKWSIKPLREKNEIKIKW